MKLLTIVMCFIFSLSSFADEALDIAKKVYYANQPKDMIQEIEMKLVSNGKESQRTFVSITKTNDIVNNNSIVQFTEPRKSRGVALLTMNKKDSDADQYIFLPALKKVRRISSSKKSGRFVGSDIYYEDLQNRHYSKNNYKILKKGKGFTILSSTPKDDSSIYSRVISKIDLDKMMGVVNQFYIDGKLDKTVKLTQIKKFGNIWVPMKVDYENKKIKHSTHLKVTSVKIDKGVKNNVFSKRSIENKNFYKSYK